MTQKIIKLSYESLNDQRLTGLGCDLYIVSSNGIGFPAHASVVCSQSDVFQVVTYKGVEIRAFIRVRILAERSELSSP